MLTLGQLNYEIDNFLYGCNDKRSKPQLILKSKLKNGWQLSEKWTLFRLLPQLVDSLIMPNKYWDCYLQLCEVVDIIMAPVNLSQKCTILCIIHSSLSCMDHCSSIEANTFKKLPSVVCNYENISKTLATRHQMRHCWEQIIIASLGKKSMPHWKM